MGHYCLVEASLQPHCTVSLKTLKYHIIVNIYCKTYKKFIKNEVFTNFLSISAQKVAKKLKITNTNVNSGHGTSVLIGITQLLKCPSKHIVNNVI